MVCSCYFWKRVLKIENKDTVIEKIIEMYYRLFSTSRSGISNGFKKRKIIVSLTTIPNRIDKVWITIESLLRQNYKPDKIVLWLAKEEFEGIILPDRLLKQQERGLCIRYCENLKSYKKFYYTMLENPNDYIVTVDDDIIYAETMVRDLVRLYKKNPKCIVCNRSHLVAVGNNNLKPYHRWVMYSKRTDIKEQPAYYNFFTSGAGTLIPAFLLDKRIYEKEIFMKLAPTADDVWLNFIAWISKIKTINTLNGQGNFISIESNSQKGLYYQNLHRQENDIQIHKVVNYLGINVKDYI